LNIENIFSAPEACLPAGRSGRLVDKGKHHPIPGPTALLFTGKDYLGPERDRRQTKNSNNASEIQACRDAMLVFQYPDCQNYQDFSIFITRNAL